MGKKIYSKILVACAVVAASLLVAGISVNAQDTGAPGLLSITESSWTQSQVNGPAKDDVIDGSITATPAPEPATMLLFGAGLIGLGSVLRKREKK